MNPKDLVPHRSVPKLLNYIITDNQWDWAMRQRHENGLDEYIYDINGNKLADLPGIKSGWLESRKESNLKPA